MLGLGPRIKGPTREWVTEVEQCPTIQPTLTDVKPNAPDSLQTETLITNLSITTTHNILFTRLFSSVHRLYILFGHSVATFSLAFYW